MRYSTFELLALVFGGAAILGTVIAGVMGGSGLAEVVAQVMLLPVLWAALHFGRNGGFVAALFALALYVGLRVPDLAREGLGGPLASLLAVRTLVYVLVGVVGGEMCSRIKYFFLGLEDRTLIDTETGVYGAAHSGALLRQLMEQHRRYGQRFSAAMLELGGAGHQGGEARSGRRSIAKEMAAALRADVRAVDEVGRIGPYEFLVLFPNTAADGAVVAVRRLEKTVTGALGRFGLADDASVTAQTIAFPEDAERMAQLVETLTGEPITPGEPHPRRTVTPSEGSA